VDVRVLIIDDHSTDDTGTIGERLGAQDPRVAFRRHDVNAGFLATANEGVVGWASAPYTLLLSADDALTPGALARACHVLDNHPEAGMVYGLARIISAEDVSGDEADAGEPTYQVVSGARFLERCCAFGNPVPSPTAVVRTAIQQRTGGYCPRMLHTSDMEMWMRVATDHAIGVIRETQAYYRWHRANMTSQYVGGSLSDRRERIMTCTHVHDTWGGARIAGFSTWIEEMKRRLSREACWLAGLAYERGDKRAARECLEFAAAHHPRLWASDAWWRCQAKRLTGPAVVKTLRRLARSPAHHDGAGSAEPFSSGQSFGWWPEAELSS
jgi:glycosyltransferase involved in cell wall biosynthesis